MLSAKKHIDINVEEIRVEPGEYITVWLNGIQVELRVLPNGRRQIYCNKLHTVPFSKWISYEGTK